MPLIVQHITIKGNKLLSVLCVVLVILASPSMGQTSYTFDQTIPVTGPEGKLLANPWAGGLNAAQFNTMRLDQDQKEDLVIFDRMANIVITFLNDDGHWKYAPQYEALFPKLTNWLLLRDFNCDGRKDIFTGDIFGAKVYQNVTIDNGLPEWKPFIFSGQNGLKTDVLLTKGFSQKVNLQLQFDDLPAIVDADNDGDLDIFNVRFTGNGSIEYHRNFSRERYGICDSLDFERVTNTWGGVTQCKCERFAYNDKECSINSGRTQHAGGKALLAIDIDNDSDHELIFSEAECSNLYALTNKGSLDDPLIDSNFLFPQSDPVHINIFPAAFHEDVDMDGVKDIIASPNIYRKDILSQDLRFSTWFYKNMGSTVPDFQLVKKNFLQDEMVDVGDNAVPAFLDIDGDADPDLFVSYNSDSSSYGSICFYRNTGNSQIPRFTFESWNFADLKSLSLNNLRIQFADMNSDGATDLCFSATDQKGVTRLCYLPGERDSQSFIPTEIVTMDFQLDRQDNFHLSDVNQDGRADLLIGRAIGSLEYWRNVGSGEFPSFAIQDESYLGLHTSTSRQSFSISSADLDNDGHEELLLLDQVGELTIVNDYRNAQSAIGIKDVVYNPLLEKYTPTSMGRSWSAVAPLFDSKRPAIVVGDIRGGLHVLCNEDKNPKFDDLSLRLYPNPVSSNESLVIKSNMALRLDVYTVIGQPVFQDISISSGENELPVSVLSAGLYILRFEGLGGVISQKLVVR